MPIHRFKTTLVLLNRQDGNVGDVQYYHTKERE